MSAFKIAGSCYGTNLGFPTKPFISDGQNKRNDSLCCYLPGRQLVGIFFLQQMWMKYVDGTDIQVSSCNALVSY